MISANAKIAIGLLALALLALLTWWSRRREAAEETSAADSSPPDEEEMGYLRTNAHYLVWAGFHNRAEILEMSPEVTGVDAPPSLMVPLVDAELACKREAEAGWPSETDCDRLDAAFNELQRQGVLGQQYAGYTQSDGLSDVSEALSQEDGQYTGFCFYTAQDVEHLLDGERSLFLAFGANNEDGAGAVEVGRRIREVMHGAGFETAWDETVSTRIALTNIEWKRRAAVGAPFYR